MWPPSSRSSVTSTSARPLPASRSPRSKPRSICQIRRSQPTPFENTGGIENKSHYTRDVTFRADASRVQTNPGIIARLWSMAYNLPRSNRSETKPQDRFARKSDLTKATVNFRRMGWRFCSSDLGRSGSEGLSSRRVPEGEESLFGEQGIHRRRCIA
jgi:hypothetical protein